MRCGKGAAKRAVVRVLADEAAKGGKQMRDWWDGAETGGYERWGGADIDTRAVEIETEGRDRSRG